MLLIGLLSALTTSSALNDSPEFHQTSALPGDGVYSLLRRYQLDKHSCNFDQFYSLNKLKKNSPLVVGRQYFLPILVYTFNGKTIRSSIGIDDWDVALRIQKYNELMFEQKVREGDFRKDRILWVPFHELNCPKQDLGIPTPVAIGYNPEEEKSASGAGSRIFPVFGKDYAYTPLISNKLKGKVYYIDPGHGGPDPGAMGKREGRTLCEDEYAYDVALRLCRKLIEHGATAYMIVRDPNDGIRSGKYLDCDYDEVLWGDIKMSRHHKTRLTQRSDVVNELFEKHRLQGVTNQYLIIVHVDSRSHGERTDVFFYHHPDSDESRQLALQLQNTMRAKYQRYQQNRPYHGTVTGRDLHMLRETTPLSVYIELANIRNSIDQQRLVLERNRQYLAEWLFEGLLNE
jgi:N-acetylmuramoyl-L-alanine amidase